MSSGAGSPRISHSVKFTRHIACTVRSCATVPLFWPLASHPTLSGSSMLADRSPEANGNDAPPLITRYPDGQVAVTVPTPPLAGIEMVWSTMLKKLNSFAPTARSAIAGRPGWSMGKALVGSG